MTNLSIRSLAVHLLFLLSGFAGIGYQLAWTRMLAVGLGHEAPSMLAVVAGFFGGLALGAWALDRVVSRSARPGLWYAGLELVIGAWGAGTAWLIPWAAGRVGALIGLDPSPLRHWAVAFAVPLVLMAPATVAMGATLPAVDRLVERLRAAGDGVGGLYSINTAGAMGGVLASTFLLIPSMGLRACVLVLAVCNLMCAAGAWLAQRAAPTAAPRQPAPIGAPPDRQRPHRSRPLPNTPPAPTPGRARLLLMLAATGLLGVGYEVLAVLVIAQVLQDTVYTFALALAVYLLGTAVGAAIYRRAGARRPYGAVLMVLLVALSLACLLGTLSVAAASQVQQAASESLGGGYAGGLIGESVLALVVFLLPTTVMGALFTHLCLGVRTAAAAPAAPGGVGAALAVNTLGGSLAPPFFGALLLPLVGAKPALIALSLAYLALLPRWNTRALAGAVLAACVAGMGLMVNIDHIDVPPGGRVVEVRAGVMGQVAVVTDAQGARFLKLNNRFQMGATASTFAERRLLLLPMLLHPAPRRALVLGVGTGVTIGAAGADPAMRTEAVELLRDILKVMPRFEPENHAPQRLANVLLANADARRFVRAAPGGYDLIVADLFHPARDGAGTLYTREHFEAIRSRLAPDGLFVQWLPLYQLDLEVFSIVCRTYLEVFPDARALIAHFNHATPMIGLVSGRAPHVYAPGAIAARLGEPGMRAAAEDVSIRDPLDVLGCFIADAPSLRHFADAHSPGAPVNTDDRPLVIFRAPRYAYDSREPPAARLLAILDACRISTESLTGVPAADSGDRLAHFQRARRLFIDASSDASSGMQARALASLVEAVRACHEFRPAYAQGLAEAEQLAGRDRPAAISLLEKLVEADPSRSEGRALLARLRAAPAPAPR